MWGNMPMMINCQLACLVFVIFYPSCVLTSDQEEDSRVLGGSGHNTINGDQSKCLSPAHNSSVILIDTVITAGRCYSLCLKQFHVVDVSRLRHSCTLYNEVTQCQSGCQIMTNNIDVTTCASDCYDDCSSDVSSSSYLFASNCSRNCNSSSSCTIGCQLHTELLDDNNNTTSSHPSFPVNLHFELIHYSNATFFLISSSSINNISEEYIGTSFIFKFSLLDSFAAYYWMAHEDDVLSVDPSLICNDVTVSLALVNKFGISNFTLLKRMKYILSATYTPVINCSQVECQTLVKSFKTFMIFKFSFHWFLPSHPQLTEGLYGFVAILRRFTPGSSEIIYFTNYINKTVNHHYYTEFSDIKSDNGGQSFIIKLQPLYYDDTSVKHYIQTISLSFNSRPIPSPPFPISTLFFSVPHIVISGNYLSAFMWLNQQYQFNRRWHYYYYVNFGIHPLSINDTTLLPNNNTVYWLNTAEIHSNVELLNDSQTLTLILKDGIIRNNILSTQQVPVLYVQILVVDNNTKGHSEWSQPLQVGVDIRKEVSTISTTSTYRTYISSSSYGVLVSSLVPAKNGYHPNITLFSNGPLVYYSSFFFPYGAIILFITFSGILVIILLITIIIIIKRAVIKEHVKVFDEIEDFKYDQKIMSDSD